MIRIAYFGLPLGALLLARDGDLQELVVLSPTEAPGRRRLRRTTRARLVDAREMSPSALLAAVDDAIRKNPPDLIVSWYYTRRIERRWLDAARLGGIGAHPSLLPRHRGPNPFFAAIDAGDATTGVTVHALVERYDEGDILLTETIPIDGRDAWQLARALDRPSLRLLRRAVGEFSRGAPPSGTPQQEALATYAPEPTGELLRAALTWDTERVLRRVRALSPVPGLALAIRGVEFFVVEARAAKRFPLALAPGEAHVDAGGVVIRTGDGAILVTRAIVAAKDSDDATVLHRTAFAELVARAPIDE